jgi:hypothetical protein
MAILMVLAGAEGPYAAKWGVFGFFLTGLPLWCFGVLASIGGILFFLWPMIFGSESSIPPGQVSENSERMLFLYLRPFELDARNFLQLMVGASAGILVYAGLINGVWWVISFVPLFINISKEQAFKDAFEPLGEFIAFGKPRERLRPIGALRIYAGDNWQQEISRYMAQARLVIVRPGRGKSIRWEVKQVLRSVPPERILFYLRFRGSKKKREKKYEKFRRLFQTAYPTKKLPEQLGESPYLIFDPSCNPCFVREANRPGEFVRQLTSRSEDIIIDRWRPVLKALNIDIPPRSNDSLSKIIAVFTWSVVFISVGLVIAATLIAIVRIISAFALHFRN